jgi:hypothetical protein
MGAELPPIERVTVLDLRPGDTVVLHLPDDRDVEDLGRLSMAVTEDFKRTVGIEDLKVLILWGEGDLSVLRPGEAQDAP